MALPARRDISIAAVTTAPPTQWIACGSCGKDGSPDRGSRRRPRPCSVPSCVRGKHLRATWERLYIAASDRAADGAHAETRSRLLLGRRRRGRIGPRHHARHVLEQRMPPTERPRMYRLSKERVCSAQQTNHATNRQQRAAKQAVPCRSARSSPAVVGEVLGIRGQILRLGPISPQHRLGKVIEALLTSLRWRCDAVCLEGAPNQAALTNAFETRATAQSLELGGRKSQRERAIIHGRTCNTFIHCLQYTTQTKIIIHVDQCCDGTCRG